MRQHRHGLVRAIVAFLATIGLLAVAAASASASTVPAGRYFGPSDAYDGGEVSFDVDEDGVMSNFWTNNNFMNCGGTPTGIQFTAMPPTPITAGQPFELEWFTGQSDAQVRYRLSGVVNADGTASGQGSTAMPGYCQDIPFSWTARSRSPWSPRPRTT